ncbi:hypothetical protein [Tenacibaculum sp.]|uniref:hypothetical protein n=1 Tax=Tenacibaculum sp. TaxID=1906242 RepID=UPI003AA7E5BD
MGAKFGDIEISQILDNEFRISVLENALDILTRKNPDFIGLTQAEIEEIRENAAETLRKKYPNSGIEYKKAR